jgi:Mn2+/Fe2+ NRAMP family transporter
MGHANSNRHPVVEPSKPRLLSVLGPGLITGAADDDPSGTATYAQTGAQFGYCTVWTMPFCYPLMAAVQIITARLGRMIAMSVIPF